MKFTQSGNSSLPTVILLHGGGLSDWSWREVVPTLSEQYHVVTPVIDGHGADANTPFLSIEHCADALLSFIDTQCGGKVFAVGGLSIGAQIAAEVLSRRSDVCERAVLESALVYPIPGTAALTAPTYKLCYGLIQKRWFAKLQAKQLCVPDAFFEQYYQDSKRMTRDSLVNMTLSNGTYCFKDSIAQTQAKTLVIVGEKELGIMKKSACRLHEAITDSRLYYAPGMGHGVLSLVHTEQYLSLLRNFFEQQA